MPLFYYARQSSLATKEGAKLWHLSLKKVEGLWMRNSWLR